MNIIKDAVVIPKEYHLFTPLRFVCAAISKDETRPALMHLLVKKEDGVWHFVACDGRRCHHHEMDPGMFDDDMDLLDQGCYTLIAKSTKFLVLQKGEISTDGYVNWRGAWPDLEPDEVLSCDCEETAGQVMLRTGNVFSHTYLVEAMGYRSALKPDKRAEIEFAQVEGNGPLVLSHEFGRALVMPIRIDDDQNQVGGTDDEEDQGPELPGTSDQEWLGGDPELDRPADITDIRTAKGEVIDVDEVPKLPAPADVELTEEQIGIAEELAGLKRVGDLRGRLLNLAGVTTKAVFQSIVRLAIKHEEEGRGRKVILKALNAALEESPAAHVEDAEEGGVE